MYPKDVVDYILADTSLRRRFATLVAPRGDNPNIISSADDRAADDPALEQWLVSEGHEGSSAIRRYLLFLTQVLRTFDAIHLYFDKKNPLSRHPIDEGGVATSPREMVFIANHLYLLDSHGVGCDVLECGAFKGFSSCCLSWACSLLDRRLLVADSFQGLPHDGTQDYYQRGQFTGTLAEVTANLASLGRPRSVEIIPGYFASSLVGFSRSIAVLWLDVDLYSSASDVLGHVFPCLDRRGVIFSNEFAPHEVSPDHQIIATGDVARAFADYFTAQRIPHVARHVADWSALIVPFAGQGTHPALSVKRFKRLVRLLRQSGPTVARPSPTRFVGRVKGVLKSGARFVTRLRRSLGTPDR
jgi:hypothetical protein